MTFNKIDNTQITASPNNRLTPTPTSVASQLNGLNINGTQMPGSISSPPTTAATVAAIIDSTLLDNSKKVFFLTILISMKKEFDLIFFIEKG